MKNRSTNQKNRKRSGPARLNRKGQTAIDYILVIGVILPLLLFLFAIIPRMIQLVYEMTVVFLNSPFS